MSPGEVATGPATRSGWRESVARSLVRNGWVQQFWELLVNLPGIGAALRRASRAIVPEGQRAWVQIPGGRLAGFWLELDPRFDSKYFRPDYEDAVQTLIENHLHEGETFYDVGAHIGVMSLIAARIVGQRGCVVAFEADDANAAMTQAHAKRNGCSQILVVPKAAWSSCGTLAFQRDARSSSHNQGRVRTQSGGEAQSDSVSVDAITLDSLADVFPAPDLVKIDVEGAEAEVLAGSQRIFERSHPRLICEIHDRNAAARVSVWLSKHGYHWTLVGNGNSFQHHVFAEFGGPTQFAGMKAAS